MFVVQTREKLAHCLLIFLNMLKYCILAIFIRNFLKILRPPGEVALSPLPPPPSMRPSTKGVSPEPKSWLRHWVEETPRARKKLKRFSFAYCLYTYVQFKGRFIVSTFLRLEPFGTEQKPKCEFWSAPIPDQFKSIKLEPTIHNHYQKWTEQYRPHWPSIDP